MSEQRLIPSPIIPASRHQGDEVHPDARLFKLSILSRLIDPGPNGRPRHVSTLRRYIMHGKQGVRLRGWVYPDGMYSSVREWKRFIRRLTANRTGMLVSSALPSERRSKARQTTVEVEIEKLRKNLRHKEK